MLELPAGYFQHPDTDDASQAVIVVAKATLKIKGLVYLLADIIGPATLLQDNLVEHHVPISSGKTLVLSTLTLFATTSMPSLLNCKCWLISGLASRHTSRTSQHSTQLGQTLAAPL